MSNHPNQVLGSIVVSILACHARDRGSIPRRGGYFCGQTTCFPVLTNKYPILRSPIFGTGLFGCYAFNFIRIAPKFRTRPCI